MRLSEKTIELTFCGQFQKLVGHRVIWFGLTQRQEARAGFDACSRLNGRLIVFQFKASNQDIRGSRRFHAPHGQLEKLVARVNHRYRSIFYVFPMLGNTLQLQKANGRLIEETYLLDVADITKIGRPTKLSGGLRKNGVHHVDIAHNQKNPANAIIHSEPVPVPLLRASEFAARNVAGSDGLPTQFDLQFVELFARHAVGAVVY